MISKVITYMAGATKGEKKFLLKVPHANRRYEFWKSTAPPPPPTNPPSPPPS